MIEIFIILIISIVILCRFQYSSIKNKDSKNKYEIIFNYVKIPLLFIAVLLIFYNYNRNVKVSSYDTIIQQKVYTTNPNF